MGNNNISDSGIKSLCINLKYLKQLKVLKLYSIKNIIR